MQTVPATQEGLVLDLDLGSVAHLQTTTTGPTDRCGHTAHTHTRPTVCITYAFYALFRVPHSFVRAMLRRACAASPARTASHKTSITPRAVAARAYTTHSAARSAPKSLIVARPAGLAARATDAGFLSVRCVIAGVEGRAIMRSGVVPSGCIELTHAFCLLWVSLPASAIIDERLYKASLFLALPSCV